MDNCIPITPGVLYSNYIISEHIYTYMDLYIRYCSVCLYCTDYTVLSWCNVSSTSILNLRANFPEKNLPHLRVTAFLFHRDQSHKHQNVATDSNIQDVGTEPPEFQESTVNGVGSSQSMSYISESF